MNLLHDLTGIKVLVDDLLGVRQEQFRFPRTKNRRIRRKWAKRPENLRTVCDPVAYKIPGGLLISSTMLRRMKERGL